MSFFLSFFFGLQQARLQLLGLLYNAVFTRTFCGGLRAIFCLKSLSLPIKCRVLFDFFVICKLKRCLIILLVMFNNSLCHVYYIFLILKCSRSICTFSVQIQSFYEGTSPCLVLAQYRIDAALKFTKNLSKDLLAFFTDGI